MLIFLSFGRGVAGLLLQESSENKKAQSDLGSLGRYISIIIRHVFEDLLAGGPGGLKLTQSEII